MVVDAEFAGKVGNKSVVLQIDPKKGFVRENKAFFSRIDRMVTVSRLQAYDTMNSWSTLEPWFPLNGNRSGNGMCHMPDETRVDLSV